MFTQSDFGRRLMIMTHQARTTLIRLALGLVLALTPQPALLHAAPSSSIPDEGPAMIVDDSTATTLPAAQPAACMVQARAWVATTAYAGAIH